VVFFGLFMFTPAVIAADRPNIVLVVADDVG
jgi:hypothetical protein